MDINTIATCSVDGVDYLLPKDVDQVVGLVQYAEQHKAKIVVRGSGHSFPLIRQVQDESHRQPEVAPKPLEAGKYLYIMLSYLNSVIPDQATGQVKVGAGCHLGYDPFDPSGVSTLENSLLYQLDPVNKQGNRLNLKGWSLPDLGGISHQTIGGFMATGSSGGSTKYAFEDAIIALDIVHYGLKADGTMGVMVSTITRPADGNPTHKFFGIGFANMGLMGLVVSVTFQCEAAFTPPQADPIWTFDITGSEAITVLEDCAIDLFGAGQGTKPSLQTFLQETDYTRLFWWPQKDMEPEGNPPQSVSTERVVVWQASRTLPVLTGFKPYQEVPYINGSPTLATLGADILFTAIGRWPQWLENVIGSNSTLAQGIEALVHSKHDFIFRQLLDVFVQLDKAKQGTDKGPQLFNDTWWRGLPMDNQMSDRLFPVWFTELWIPIEHTQAVMNALHTFYTTQANPATQEPDHAGTFCCEIYAAGKNLFWMSPAYNTDVIRIDVLWFANNEQKPEPYYQLFWKLLSPFAFRPHWGKYLPDPLGDQGLTYLKPLYPKWQDWMNLREEMDPCQLFVSDYWRNNLGISPPVS